VLVDAMSPLHHALELRRRNHREHEIDKRRVR
jgi:hypothetical protein